MRKLSECFSPECLKDGLHLRLSYYQFPIFITAMHDDETGESKVMGVYPEHVIPFVFRSLNITYDYILSDVYPYGSAKINNSWPGDLGMLQEGIADVCVGAHYVDYFHHVDFCPLEFILRLPLVILASVGKKELFDFFSFLYEVQGLIWFLLSISMVFHILISSLSDSIAQLQLTLNNFWYNCYRTFWIYFASIFCEGSQRTMFSRRAQNLLFMWLMVVLVLVNILFSQFKGILMVHLDDTYFRTVEDLAKRSDILSLMVPNSIVERSLSESSLESFRMLHKRALDRAEESFIDMSRLLDIETYQLVKEGAHVLLNADLLCRFILKDICLLLSGNRKFYFIPEELTVMDTVFHVSWEFPLFLRNLINQRLLWIREGGFHLFWFAPFQRNYELCEMSIQEDENILLQLKHLDKAFIFYLILLCFAFCVFLLEIIYNNLQKMSGNKYAKQTSVQ